MGAEPPQPLPVKKRGRHEFFTVDGGAGGSAEGAGSLPTNMSPDTIEEEAGTTLGDAEEAGSHWGEGHSAEGSRNRSLSLSLSLEQGEQQPSADSLEIQEDKLRKKRNRDEVACIYRVYRRLKACLAGNCDLQRDVEEAFHALLSLANGCASVRRIAADLIPRYANRCPSALEAASQALLQICDWSCDLMLHGGREADDVVEQTARAAYAGLVDLAAAAPMLDSADLSMDSSGAGQGVSRTIALRLLHRVYGKKLVFLRSADGAAAADVDDTFASQDMTAATASQRFDMVLVSSVVNTFRSSPQAVLAACFDLLASPIPDDRKEGQHFLTEIMAFGRILTPADHGGDVSSRAAGAGDAITAPEDMQVETDDDAQVEIEPEDDSPQKSSEPNADSSENLVMQVIHPSPPLERWIVKEVRHFRRSASQEALGEAMPLLNDLVRSLCSFRPTDLDLNGGEMEDTRALEDERTLRSDDRGEPKWPRKADEPAASEQENLRSHRSGDGKGAGSNGDVSGSRGHAPSKGEPVSSSCETGEDQAANRMHVRPDDHNDYNGEGAAEDLPPGRERLSGNGTPRGEKRAFGYKSWEYGRTGDSKYADKPLPSHADRAKGPANGGLKRDAAGSSTGSLLSPPQPSTPQHSSSPSRQVVWYQDGDPAAMDVYAASRVLSVGPLGQGMSESSLQAEFEQFGVVENINILRAEDFALVSFKQVKEAVKAREMLQGKLQYGKPLQVRFLDGGLSSQISGISLSSLCHVWIGGVTSQRAKDELLNDLASAGLKGPRTVFALVTAGAILLEFEVPEDAAAVIQHIRQRRREGGGPAQPSTAIEKAAPARPTVPGNRHLWVGRIDPAVREEELIGAFLQYGELTGWKVLRASSCCFIDFRSTADAAVAKTQLNGTRFGCQCIQVEFKNNPVRNPPAPFLGSPPHGSSSLHSPAGRLPGGQALASALANLSSKFHMMGGAGNVAPGRFRNFRAAGREGTERVPTNTLWIGLPDSVGPSFMNETELKSLFNLAASGVGVVTKVRSARISRGPCRFVEFDRVEAAAVALRGVSGRLDPSIQIEFSNSAISMQQSDNPQFYGYQNAAYGQGSVDESRRRAFDYHRDRERSLSRSTREWEHEREEMHSPTQGTSDEAGTPGRRSLPPGWGGASDKEFTPEEAYRREHRRNRFESSSDLREDSGRGDPFSRGDSSSYRNSADFRDVRENDESPPLAHGSTLTGRKSFSDRQPSVRPPLPPQGGTLAPPNPKHPPRLHIEKVPSGGGWSGPPGVEHSSQAASNTTGRPAAVSPAGFATKHGRNIPPPSQSPVTPAVSKMAGPVSRPPLPPVSPPTENLARPSPLSPPPNPVQPQSLPPPRSPRSYAPPAREFAPEATGRRISPAREFAPEATGRRFSPAREFAPEATGRRFSPAREFAPEATGRRFSPAREFAPEATGRRFSPAREFAPEASGRRISPAREFAPEATGRRTSFEMRSRRGLQQWIGPLCKSGTQYCEVIAYRQESSLCQYENGLREPTGWPDKLDVTKRADFKSVRNSFNNTPPQQREVCRISVSSSAHNSDGFEQFVSYLKERERAGVVKISGGDRIWSRMLYILPWSVDTCSMLGISPHPSDCLLGLLLPSPANTLV